MAKTKSMNNSDLPSNLDPGGFAPADPPHALSRAASSARSVRVARFAVLARVFFRAALPGRSAGRSDGESGSRGPNARFHLR